MKSVLGITLLECVVYCALVALATTLLVSGVSSCLISLRVLSHYTDTLVAAETALDIFARDCGSAPQNASLWKAMNTTHISWKHNDSVVEWYMKGTKLIRKVYGFERHKAVMIDGIKSVQFVLYKEGDSIRLVECSLVVQDVSIKRLRSIV